MRSAVEEWWWVCRVVDERVVYRVVDECVVCRVVDECVVVYRVVEECVVVYRVVDECVVCRVVEECVWCTGRGTDFALQARHFFGGCCLVVLVSAHVRT